MSAEPQITANRPQIGAITVRPGRINRKGTPKPEIFEL